jgi:hypothetical protein
MSCSPNSNQHKLNTSTIQLVPARREVWEGECEDVRVIERVDGLCMRAQVAGWRADGVSLKALRSTD